MVWTTLLFGALLIALGVFGYLGAEQTYWTALIPGVLGVALLVSGLLGLKQTFRKNAMHAAVLLALLGLVGTAHGLVGLVQLVLRDSRLVVESVTAVLCAVFIWLAVKSFIEARRRQPPPDQPTAEHGHDQPSP
jgi:ABC-type transport system involved in cytochrome c biogenesis permease component